MPSDTNLNLTETDRFIYQNEIRRICLTDF